MYIWIFFVFKICLCNIRELRVEKLKDLIDSIGKRDVDNGQEDKDVDGTNDNDDLDDYVNMVHVHITSKLQTPKQLENVSLSKMLANILVTFIRLIRSTMQKSNKLNQN